MVANERDFNQTQFNQDGADFTQQGGLLGGGITYEQSGKDVAFTCPQDGLACYGREIFVYDGMHSRMVYYLNHGVGLDSSENVDAIEALLDFYAQLFLYEDSINKLPQADRLLTYGAIRDIELEVDTMSGHAAPTQVRARTNIHAFRLIDSHLGGWFNLATGSSPTTLSSSKTACNPLSVDLKAKFDSGL